MSEQQGTNEAGGLVYGALGAGESYQDAGSENQPGGQESQPGGEGGGAENGAQPAYTGRETPGESAANSGGWGPSAVRTPNGEADAAQQKPHTDREWAAWRKKTEAKAAALAAKQTAKLDGEVAARFGHLKNPLSGEAVKTVEDYFAALDAQKQVAAALATIDGAGADDMPGMLPAGQPAKDMAPTAAVPQHAGHERLSADVAGTLAERMSAESMLKVLAQDAGLAHATGSPRPELAFFAQAAEAAALPVDSQAPGQPDMAAVLAAGQAAQKAAESAQLALGDRLLDEQVAEIHRMDPSVRCFEDILRSDTFAAFDRMVKGGQDLVSAYKAANFEKLSRRAQDAARRAAVTSAAGKQHMARLPAAAAGDAGGEIPGGALPIWREMFPDEDDGALRARYNKAAAKR